MKIHCIVIFFLTATILLVTAGRKLFNRNDRQRNLDFREVGTTEHNRYRSNHHSPKLVYDRNLALKAYDCTVSLIENMTNGPSCGTYKTIGENVHISNRGDLPDTPWGRAEAVHDAIHSCMEKHHVSGTLRWAEGERKDRYNSWMTPIGADVPERFCLSGFRLKYNLDFGIF
ncbi:unnamed protein product [Allacma fusca]|uniref:Uncharacterized protein n=1 Tax=Allacma fusca TaxID=39272 RepID=A0A8J2KDJ1_9HEXA|nr:unnamed protein product [Allacma fusca]